MLDPAKAPELLTCDEMRRADAHAIEGGTPGLALMENAGAAVADVAASLARSRGRIVVLSGPGANGGDGFVAARRLAERGYRIELGLLGRRGALRGDAASVAQRWTGEIKPAGALTLSGPCLVVDALFGAGLDRDLEGEALEIVERLNASAGPGRPVVAVDMPSGLSGDTGKVRRAAVQATATVTFFRLKPGHLLSPGRELCGRLVLADIGIPEDALAAIAPKAFVNAPGLWRAKLRKPQAGDHKYSRGAVLVLSGPPHRTGAARLAARAALRIGAGLVALASPPEAVAVNAAHATAVMIEPFEGLSGFARLLADPRRNAIVIGPGAGVGEDTRALVRAALEPSQAPRAVVLDADALTSFSGDADGLAAAIAAHNGPVALTPHEGEFARLFRLRREILDGPSKLERARIAAVRLGAVLVLKGSDTVVGAPDGRASIGYDLPPTLATAGSGDVLSGFVAGLLAQGAPAFEAASAAVWLHGAAARQAGPGLIAEDLPEAVRAALAGLA